MRNKRITGLALGLLAGTGAFGAPFAGKVVSVEAADLLTVERDGAPYPVRLYGADAPEPGQPFAAESLAFVKERALGQEVKVETLATDSGGKMVGSVALPDGTDLATALVTGGMAWWDEPNAQEAKALKGATAKALVGKTGLFKEPGALAPWDYRKSHGGELYTYSLKPVEVKEEAPKGPIEIKAKGDMTESAPATDLVAALPPSLKIPEQYAGMVKQFNPRFATDANGNVRGVTADGLGMLGGMFGVGIQDGDVITGINGMPIRNASDIEALVSGLNGVKDVKVSVDRGGKVVEVPIPIP